MEKLTVKSSGKHRIRNGSLWIFSNELHHRKELQPGTPVTIYDSSDKYLGWGYYNFHSLISFRLLSRRQPVPIKDLIRTKLLKAIELRKFWYGEKKDLRLLFSEGDEFPGLIIDRYGDYLVVQSNTAGTDHILYDLIEVLVELLNPAGILLKPDETHRQAERIETNEGILYGNLPEHPVVIRENGLKLEINVRKGQKTGFFYDQRENRDLLSGLELKGKSAIDIFSYVGTWGMKAIREGAASVDFIDSSGPACEAVAGNIKLNGLPHEGDIYQQDAIGTLKHLKEKGKRYDCVILDPPAFIKKKSQVSNGIKGYYNINKLALDILKPMGVFITCSCSHHLLEDKFREIISNIAKNENRTIHSLFSGHQAFDHPVNVLHKETNYLKCHFYQMV